MAAALLLFAAADAAGAPLLSPVTTPNLATLYDAMPGPDTSPAIDAVFTMCPSVPCDSMIGTKVFTP